MFRKKRYDDINELLVQCIKGNRRAHEQLFKHYYGYAMSLALRYSHTHEVASLIVSDSFMKAFQNLNSQNKEKDFKLWFRSIVINTSLDHYRKEKKHDQTVPIEYAQLHEADHSAIDMLQAEDIIKLLQQVPHQYRITFSMYEIDGYSHEEIATILNISVNTSRANLSRAKKLLRNIYLNQEGV